jgi:hypothetical protein
VTYLNTVNMVNSLRINDDLILYYNMSNQKGRLNLIIQTAGLSSTRIGWLNRRILKKEVWKGFKQTLG